MQPELINGWWGATDNRIGPYTITNLQPLTDKQLHNAYKLKANFESWGVGWTLSAICGTIGNFIHESTLSTAFIQQNANVSHLPNSGASLSDVPNSTMINYYDSYYGQSDGGFAIGLAQWDGYTSTPPAGQKLVSYAERQNMIWYDGNLQCMRLRAEYDNDLQFAHHEVFGTTWTWYNYVVNTRTPEESADIWRDCYERPGGGFPEAEGNARALYDYFTLYPYPPVEPWLLMCFNNKRKEVLKNVRKYI